MRDPYQDRFEHLIIAAPGPCTHGNGSNCECQLPHYKGFFVAPILFADGKTRHVIVKVRQAHDGGMREFSDPISDAVIGSCGLFFANDGSLKTLDEWVDSQSESM